MAGEARPVRGGIGPPDCAGDLRQGTGGVLVFGMVEPAVELATSGIGAGAPRFVVGWGSGRPHGPMIPERRTACSAGRARVHHVSAGQVVRIIATTRCPVLSRARPNPAGQLGTCPITGPAARSFG